MRHLSSKVTSVPGDYSTAGSAVLQQVSFVCLGVSIHRDNVTYFPNYNKSTQLLLLSSTCTGLDMNIRRPEIR